MTGPCDRRKPSFVGRHARLELAFGVHGGRTTLDHAYAEPPFRVGRWFSEGEGLHMILVMTAPGVFGGDFLEQTVHVAPHASVRLTSQAAMQGHPGIAAGDETPPVARLVSRYELGAGAALHCHWDAVIPFARARLDQRLELRLAADSRLYWSDAFLAGREAGGERWQFASFSHELCVLRDAVLEYLERYRVVPADGRVGQPWVAGGASYIGTTLVSGPALDVPSIEQLQRELAAMPGLRGSADRLGDRLLLVRLLADQGVPFHEARSLAMRSIGSAIIEPWSTTGAWRFSSAADPRPASTA